MAAGAAVAELGAEADEEAREQGSQIEAGYSVGYRDRLTRKTRWQELDEDMAYDADALDRAVQTPDQIRTVVRTFRDRLHTDIFPGRTEVPQPMSPTLG